MKATSLNIFYGLIEGMALLFSCWSFIFSGIISNQKLYRLAIDDIKEEILTMKQETM
jgi:hypothetical protein